jgi:hypothetical protein
MTEREREREREREGEGELRVPKVRFSPFVVTRGERTRQRT